MLLGALFYASIRPMRGIATTDTDVVLAHASFAVLGASEGRSGPTVPVHIGADIVKLRRSAYDQLVAAASPPTPAV